REGDAGGQGPERIERRTRSAAATARDRAGPRARGACCESCRTMTDGTRHPSTSAELDAAAAEPRRTIAVPPGAGDALFQREWLVCNGLGGYASGTIGGAPTRRYHGYLIAALPNPAGRVMMLNSLAQHVRLSDGSRADLGWVGPHFSGGHTITLSDRRIPLVA